ncbi:PD-(D/E)XK nuclease family transposase [Microcoleus sp. S13_B4]|uniref:PD-(D/E)XK nuclease family transposase n=1 Tax=Microcoleus sp. S13_B4 TaxID=3055408 RepID=UPI002FD616CA
MALKSKITSNGSSQNNNYKKKFNKLLFLNGREVISHFVFKEKKRLFDYVDPEIELIFIELPKFNKQLDELETLTDKWVYFMKNAPSLEVIPQTMETVSESLCDC